VEGKELRCDEKYCYPYRLASLALTSAFATIAQQAQTPSGTPSSADNKAKTAKAKTKVCHMEGDEWYGKTKHGQYMTEDEAKKAGYHAAKKPDEKPKEKPLSK
jgi:hypothetical protein